MSSKPLPILPGATLGILGGGQLGRMFTLAARTMGYKVMVLDPDAASPAGQMADVHVRADYTDHAALKKLGEICAAVTTEFENVPAASLIELAWLWVRYQPASALTRRFQQKYAGGGKRLRRIGIVALARGLAIELWKYLQTGALPEGALTKT